MFFDEVARYTGDCFALPMAGYILDLRHSLHEKWARNWRKLAISFRSLGID
jgi:hypothetical protein